MRREADRHEILLDIERQLVVELRIDRVRRQREQERVAVGRRLGRDVGADIAGGATAIVDDDRLSQLRRKRLVRMRATTSVPPPGGYGTMNLIGFDG